MRACLNGGLGSKTYLMNRSHHPKLAKLAKLAPKPAADLKQAEAWVFDLDNTLYSPASRLFDQIDIRIRDFIAGFLKLDPDEAYRIQKLYFREHGTTMRGLMNRHDMEPGPFLDHVHDIDLSAIPPDPVLDHALGRISGRKIVFTNADNRHAERIMDKIGISHHFEGVFDIIETDYIPKPEPQVYAQLVKTFALNPETTVMVEDMARNLIPAHAMGMTTVWVQNDTPWGAEDADGDHIDHTADGLAPWLDAVLN